MRRFAVVGVAVSIGVLAFAPSGLAASARVAALQIGLRAHGFDPGPVDGVRGQLTTNALIAFQRARGVRPTGRVGRATRRALGARGRPLLGQRELGVGAVGWDVAVLEFRLRRYGLGARCRRRAVHAEHERRAAPLPESTRSHRRRHRRPADVSLAGRSRRHDDLARRPTGRELLLDRGALPRQPLAARPPQPPRADERHRAESAARASEGCTADGAGRRGTAGES